jgi:translocation and assembly module TamB
MIFAGPITEPALDLRAQREIDALTVGITVSGTASTPEISLFSSPALPQDRILSYLVMGKPLNELSTTEGSSLLGTAASLGLRNNDIVTGRIARTFGLDQLSLESGATLGDTSVVIGKYLTPKLYLSYGIGLFEPVGTTRLRYEINRRWSIQAEQSEETGVDVFYRIER